MRYPLVPGNLEIITGTLFGHGNTFDRDRPLWYLLPTLPLDMSVLQQLVLSLAVSVLQQPMLPVNVSVQKQLLLPPVAYLFYSSRLCCPWTVMFYNSLCCSWTCLFYSSLCFTRMFLFVCSTAAFTVPRGISVSSLQLHVLHQDVYVQQQ
jgi:hypothetical protein